MKLLRQLGIILFICVLGELLSNVFHLPLPGNIIGMLILFVCLCTNVIKLEAIDEISTFLLDHLAFFFLPASVGILACTDILKDSWLPILIISILSTIIVVVVTGHTTQLLKKLKKGKKQHG